MGCRVIKVKPLVEEEAWNLFADKVVAASMKGIDDLSEWRNALKELSLGKKSVNGLEDEVFQQLRFSYDRLQDLKLQQCFLSCALYPEDCIIEESRLIQLWIDEGLVDEMDSQASRV
ncbi:hypothetical protein V6N13_087953 [Hibiscus sabdariffa]|uniref:NB-ARC domain-containing protein n=1 Tax=Hibiscus sabdariffa TaxID=183260 RepID=A0ABR2FXT5_9ROSI